MTTRRQEVSSLQYSVGLCVCVCVCVCAHVSVCAHTRAAHNGTSSVN